MAPARTAAFALLLASFAFACSPAVPTSLSEDDVEAQGEDDEPSKGKTTTKAETEDDEEAVTSSSQSQAAGDAEDEADDEAPATTSSSSSGSASGGILDQLGGLSGMLPKITDLFGMLGGGSSSGGLGGLGDLFGLGLAKDDFGCCDGTKFFHCTAAANQCSTKTIRSSSCERAADLDHMCQ